MPRSTLTLEQEDKRVLAWPLVLCFAVLRSTTSLVRSRRKFVCITAVRQSVSSVQIFVPHEVRACAYLRSFGSMQPKTDSACYRMQLAASMVLIRSLSSVVHSNEGCCWHVTGQLCRNSVETKVSYARTAPHVHR
jgi:hypothetical protein